MTLCLTGTFILGVWLPSVRCKEAVTLCLTGTFTEDHSKELAIEIASKVVEVRPTVCDDAWLRDMGPTFVVSRDRKEIRCVDWVFNGWGWGAVGFDSYKDDAKVCLQIVCCPFGVVSNDVLTLGYTLILF